MTLTDRLRGIVTGGRPAAAAPALRPSHRTTVTDDPADRDVCAVLGGDWRPVGAERAFLVERRVAPDVRHGTTAVGVLADQLARTAARAHVIAEGARLPFVFFDLETTGLNGGAGTYAFLVGCGGFDEAGGFVTRQYVMTEFGHEPALLKAVDEELRGAGALVSFNGKSFDAPLIETRHLFHRVPWRGAELPHLDLLHPARRFWSRRDIAAATPGDDHGCSLGALEGMVLGASRHGDVPGHEIPARFFQFVRGGDARPLRPVLEHNRLDLLSLAALTARLCQLLAEGVTAVRTPLEALALAQLYSRSGDETAAAAAFARAASTSHDGPLIAHAHRGLALLARRARRFDEAARHWRHVLDCRGCPPALVREATEALAVHHEHRMRDFESARAFALRSLGAAGTRPGGRWAAAVEHRVSRIERKLRAALETAQTARLELGE